MNFKTLWLQYLGDAGDGYTLAIWLGTDKEDVDQDKLKEAYEIISGKESLGGHPIPESTIEGKQSSVFEIRSPGSNLDEFLIR